MVPLASGPVRTAGRPHGLADPGGNRWLTVANAVTLLRTVGAVALAVVALSTARPGLIVAGYAVYWVGDIADGYLARRLDQETRTGAVADILTDRLCTGSLGVAVVACFPWTTPAVVIFLVQFALVDLVLSLLFLRWPILSPNYFYLVDRPLYRWNWSPPAKSVNTASVVLVTALTHSALAGSLLAAAVLVAKTGFLVRGLRLVRARTELDLDATGALLVRSPRAARA